MVGKTTISGGTGYDNIQIQGANLAGALAVTVGAGTNSLTVVNDAMGPNSFSAAVSYSGDTGADTITWRGGVVGTGAVAAPATFTLGSGDDTFISSSVNTSFWGDVSVNASIGADHVTFGGYFGRKARADGGADADLDTFAIVGGSFGLTPDEPVAVRFP